MNNTISVAFAKVGEKLNFSTMEHSLENMHKAVNGYIEAVRLTDTLVMWVNEEGKLHEDAKNKINFLLVDGRGNTLDTIVDDVLFTGLDAYGDTVSLSEDDVVFLQTKIQYGVVDINGEPRMVKAITVR